MAVVGVITPILLGSGMRVSAAHSAPARTEVVAVEVLTGDTDLVSTTVVALGGVITGGVPGEVVQAELPSVHVDELTRAEAVGFVRSPELVAPPPTKSRTRVAAVVGTGATIGQNVEITNAAAWQEAGFDGSVKVGIIDYFDLGLWKSAEHGPVPDAAHRFCLDSAGENLCDAINNDGVDDGDGFEHGVAVAEIVRDMAPAADLYLATVATVSDLKAAIDWFADNGVPIVTRSLGAAYDGPGDGTGPLAAVVDHAASRGITWFNSSGNDAVDAYARVTVPADLASTGGYVDFDNGPGVDTLLRLSGDCVLFDGLRWSDWDRVPALRTDYLVEAWTPRTNPDLAHSESYNPPLNELAWVGAMDANQANGAPPLELADDFLCATNSFGFAKGVSYIRILRKPGTPTVGGADVMELALGTGVMELGRSQAAYSAAKPVVDSKNRQLIAVGAVEPVGATGATGTTGGPTTIARYSSRGPTNDGRTKPDITAPSCAMNTIYSPCFNGTSAASPTAAGVAALLLDARVTQPGPALAATVRHFTIDRNQQQGSLTEPDGPDNTYGLGQIMLPAPPVATASAPPGTYQPLAPTRILDTRPDSPVGPPHLIGALDQWGIVDLSVAGVGAVPVDATAVAVNITSTDAVVPSYVQAVPFLRSTLGESSTLNVVAAGTVTPNFAIVPVGVEGKITIYSVAGGNIVVDILGYFVPAAESVSAGRFVAIDPARTLDTRTTELAPPGWSGQVPRAGETVVVPSAIGVPAAGVSALVLNVTATDATIPGFLRAQPTGTTPATSTVNHVVGAASANSVIVPLGADGTVSVFTSAGAHIVVDVTGYITAGSAPVSTAGRFVPVSTRRAFDSRISATGLFGSGATRTLQLAGTSSLPIPVGAVGVSVNLTAVEAALPGFLTAYPADSTVPATSSLNFAEAAPVANGAVLKLSPGGALGIFAFQPTHVVVDINGYFTN